ncbi:ATP-binding cassette, subfamily C, competence factor transporting protein [Bifidobacterium bohemicum]|uniref:Competence factor, exporter ComA n=1 Tax=Bifidobacterium bohemicum DSM 22767 TaxID=1437606 RepID=A0A086ZK79_9BIFI|nr:peptide cleavage/export ABC transporter [Bifidobacterium bohemicum]KFI46929.1 Competence factor, exporter ComA [Bifidobacterium bohemicum DSM 22767]SCB85355.1 ATP-binding cassette, subfamily C, competence factor transporting protein [Bifidobacterium bohemicum]
MLHRYAYVPQVDARDCGVAALATVAKHFGSTYSLAYLREIAKTDMEGTTALGLVEAAKKIGMEPKAVKADMSLFDADDVPFPFIAHIIKDGKLLHFVVVYKAGKDSLVVADPDPHAGVHKVPKERFEKEWTGVALFIAPAPSYVPHKEKNNGLLSFVPLLLKNKRLVVNITIAALLVTIVNVLGSYYMQGLIDTYIPDQMKTTLGVVSIGLVVAYAVQAVLSFARQYLLTVLGQRLTIDVLLSYIRHIFKLPMKFFATRRTGEIVSRFSDANSIIDALGSTIISVFLDVGTVVVVGAMLGFQNVRLFLLTLVALPVYTIIILAFMKPFERMNNDTMQANSMVGSSIIEDINGIETIKSLASEQTRYAKIDHEFVDYLDKSFNYAKAVNLQEVLKSAAQLILNVAVLWFGAQLVMGNAISVGQLVTFNTLLGYFVNPLLNIINLQTKLQQARVANNRLNEVFLVEPESNERQTITDQALLRGPISLDNVSYKFGYGRNTLTDVNLEVEPGQKLAVVGMSGSGKTTLAKLLVNFYDATEGSVSISGVDVRDIDRMALRHTVNYLPQDPYIFSGSILENIMLGAKPGATQADIMHAVELAEIRDEIEAMPMNYGTQLTSDAVIVSGGQKQRIALARALLADTPVLVLDEATSNLDVATEKKVIDNLLGLEDKTIVFIAHRLMVAKRCQSIVVMKRGRIVEHGSHDDLMDQQGEYYRLFVD